MMMMMKKVAACRSEYLAITGVGIKEIKIAKKAWIWPTQKFFLFKVSPVGYKFQVQAISSENVPFVLPAVFMIIGPRVEDLESLSRYAKFISPHRNNVSPHVTELVKDVIERKTRASAASTTLEKIKTNGKDFEQEVFGKIWSELNSKGLMLYFISIDKPVPAAKQAKIKDVAHQDKMKDDVGAREAEEVVDPMENAVAIDAQSKIVSPKRNGKCQKVAVANAKHPTNKISWWQPTCCAKRQENDDD